MGFFAVLAASLFAVFLFTVFGGYSLLLWCQQSLLMVVPPAVVLAVLVWTFLKMDDKITALQKQVAENKKTLDALYPVLSSMAQKLSQGVKLKPEQLKYLQDLIATEKLKKQEQESSIMRMKQLRVILDESANARVEVIGEVFGGTKICIADASMVVKNSMSYCKFVKQQGEVKMTAL